MQDDGNEWRGGLECEVHVDRVRLEHVSEFKYLTYVLDEAGTDRAECSGKVVVEGGWQMPLGP